jgi:NAD+ diphosphatase
VKREFSAGGVVVRNFQGRPFAAAVAPRLGVLALPKGHPDGKETMKEAAAREVREEVGVELADIHYFGSQPWPFGRSLMIGFNARYAGGEIRVDGNEIAEARWFRASDLPQIPPKLSIARQLIDSWLERQTQRS